MKSTNKWWSKIDTSRFIIAGCVIIITGVALFFLGFTKPSIKNKTDLDFINGTFYDYHWIKYNKGSSLTFRLKDYDNNFKIKADFFQILKQTEFKNIPMGEKVIVGIPKGFEKYLNTDKDPFFVYSISSEKENYLDYKKVIMKHNSNFMNIFASILILLGFAVLIIRLKIKSTLSIS
jgi:uncharacterized membrane protein